MKNNEKVVTYISNFQIDFKKVPCPTDRILKTYQEEKYNVLS